MSFNRPIWHPSLAGFLIRIPIGLYFIIAGLVTLDHLDAFVEAVKQLGFLPVKAATLYAVLLPYLEIAIGGLLIVGLWTTLCAVVAAFMLFSFILVFGIFPYPSNPQLFNKDVLLLGAVLSLLASGPGAFSVDGFKEG